MMLIRQILVRAVILGASAVALLACGQQGPLYLPQTAGVYRASLPESLLPATRNEPAATHPATPASAPYP